jgi:hypothetical protein
MKSLLLLAALTLTGCARFAHGVVKERDAVLASFDDVQRRVDETYGVAVGAPICVGLSICRFGVVVSLAGLSGVAHLPSDVGGAVGIAPCYFCEQERLQLSATSEPSK